MYMSSQILGNWIGSELILDASGPSFFLIMGAIMVLAIFGFLFIEKPESTYKHVEV